MKPTASTFVLAPTERLAGIRKEKWTKPRDGRDVAYLVCDRLGQLELLAQKMPLLRDAINLHVEADAWAQVSVNGLYESVDRTDGRTGPWCKGRWRVKAVDLEAAVDEYERERASHERAVIVADQPACYAICA